MSASTAEPARRFVLTQRHTHSSEINRSRFRAIAEPLAQPEHWENALASIVDPTASHNGWAWRWGAQYRSSDDREPAGSAGRPILAAIDGQGFDHVLVVVQRWFGGIKLGVGGLVRAYGGCAAECLRTAPRAPLVELSDAILCSPFACSDAVHRLLTQFSGVVLESGFSSRGLQLRVRLPQNALEALRAALADATRGQGELQAATD